MDKTVLRRFALMLCALLLFCALSAAAEEPAPDFTVQDWDGGTVRFSSLGGKPVIINIWTTWCGPCRNELGAFEQAYRTYGDRITFMMINLTDGYTETVPGVTQFVEQNGYSFPVYFDTEALADRAYDVYSIPLSIFIDANGNILDQHIGSMSADTLQGYIDRLLS